MGMLDGKVALITGGTSGIGRVSALPFAQEGAKVAFTGRREDAGREVVEGITRDGGEALFIKSDATDFGGARKGRQRASRPPSWRAPGHQATGSS